MLERRLLVSNVGDPAETVGNGIDRPLDNDEELSVVERLGAALELVFGKAEELP